ncbi:MAG: tRNA (adenosine(37)-N6)-threonylcarbamoyltransferase complex dimerization subunit type 1 TsaB [PVC group bacterium]
MKVLGIETSTAAGSLALVEDGEVRARADIDTRLSHSALLIPVLDDLLAGAGWSVGDLEGVGAGLGPGSFTGVRIGLAAAQGLAFGCSIPLAGIGSFSALVRGISLPPGIIVPLCDGGRGRIYGGRYRKDGFAVEELISPRIVPAGELGEFCRDARIVSPDRDRIRAFPGDVAGKIGEGEWEITFPRAEWVAILAEEKLRGNPASEIETAAPIYLTGYWDKK